MSQQGQIPDPTSPLSNPKPWEQFSAPNQQVSYQQPMGQQGYPGYQHGQSNPAPQVYYLQPEPPAHPIVESYYHDFWRSPRYKVWRPIVAVILFGILMGAASVILMIPAIIIDLFSGRIDFDNVVTATDILMMSPAVFIANNLSLAALILVAFLIGKAIYGQRPKYLNNVIGKFRWKWLAQCLAVTAIVWVVYYGIVFLIDPSQYEGLEPNKDSLVLAIGVLLTTPLQCAGEEYGFRGVLNRAFASFVRPNRKIGNLPLSFIVGSIVSTLLFAAAHMSPDIWHNIFYIAFGLIACTLVWRTGGLEASIALHVINNLFAFSTLPFTDISAALDNTAGSPVDLIAVVFPLIAALIILWMSKKQQLSLTSAPDTAVAQPNLANINQPSAKANSQQENDWSQINGQS